MIKRFLVFAGDFYYPGGGWDDFRGDFETLEEAELKVKQLERDWAQIIDCEQRTYFEICEKDYDEEKYEMNGKSKGRSPVMKWPTDETKA